MDVLLTAEAARPADFTWRIGGQQGEGIDSTAEIMATVCNRLGRSVYMAREFSSRIKGGNTTATVRIAGARVLAARRGVDLLVALDQAAIDDALAEVGTGSYILADSEFGPKLAAGAMGTLLALPLTRLARECHSPLLRNMVALGASAALMGLDKDALRDFTRAQFERKGSDIAEANVRALDVGAAAAAELSDVLARPSPPAVRGAHVVISGNAAIALGALAAGCRLMATYPITPAYEIMDTLVPLIAEFGGVVVQAEDEISALALCIGAGFAGARAITATSGPGLSLMQENLGLAVMTEVPLVLVDVQRAGPSSGMATRHEQSDLLAMLFGTHGDAPRVVLAPGEPGEAYADTVAAFNLAERFHSPVIIASDLTLGLSKQSVSEEALDGNVTIERGPVMTRGDLEDVGPGSFARYSLSPSGVSARSLPGQRNGQYLASGVEHDARGNVTEAAANRVAMVRRRAAKLGDLGIPGVSVDGSAETDVLLIALGSTGFAALEAAEILRERGLRCTVARVRVLSPFPLAEIARLAAGARLALVTENNSSAQLAGVLRLNGLTKPLRSLLKYDGRPFYPEEIVAGANAWLGRADEPCAEPLVVGGSLDVPTRMGETLQ